MARLVNDPITVTLVPDSAFDELRPAEFRRGKQRFVVREVLDQWHEVGRWWEREQECTVWRVRCRDGGVYEVASTRVMPLQWRLVKIWD